MQLLLLLSVGDWRHCAIVSSGMPGLVLSPDNCPFAWGDLDPSNTRFIGPIRVQIPNGISIGSAIFAGFTAVTDRQTDRPRCSVCILHLRTWYCDAVGRIQAKAVEPRIAGPSPDLRECNAGVDL